MPHPYAQNKIETLFILIANTLKDITTSIIIMPSTISNEEKQKALDFTRAITELLEFVDNVAPLVSDGEYLKQMDNCLVVNENRTIIQQITHLTQQVRNRTKRTTAFNHANHQATHSINSW